MDGNIVSNLREVIAAEVVGGEDGKVMVSDMSEIAAPLDKRLTDNNTKRAKGKPVRKIVRRKRKKRKFEDDEEEASGDEEKSKANKGRKKRKKPVKKKFLLGYPVSPVKRVRKPKGIPDDDVYDYDMSELSEQSNASTPVQKRERKQQRPSATVHSAMPSSSSKVGTRKRGRPKAIEREEIIRPEDLVGFEDIEIFSENA